MPKKNAFTSQRHAHRTTGCYFFNFSYFKFKVCWCADLKITKKQWVKLLKLPF